ncbi:MAG: phage terminase large subunit family protein [Proteobacteria bacterium]|nr:phage terminase large subunit family protein [Pseudomonadota bacterium]MCL2306777.1 phage terminase large subunit family protein [Pseudomonadota bacterium]
MSEELFSFDHQTLNAALTRGLRAFALPEHMSLTDWANKHFYLSRESSYVEQKWTPWPFQRGVMAAMSNDEIEDITFIKSARVGYTKMILAALGYFAHHKHRNVAIWQPTDDDITKFVKTELNPMLRDVDAMKEVFPAYKRRSKENTLNLKIFLYSVLHPLGGKAATNYRRISVDVAILDELDAFDRSIEGEGSPVSLSNKRTEGASFPKRIRGSTPKTKHFSNIEDSAKDADISLRYHVPCPHCREFHKLTWGGKDETHGFKFINDDPATVKHLCPHCGVLIDRFEYLAVAELGRWQADDGTWMDDESAFHAPDGQVIATPKKVAFHIWTAYSPNVEWSDIVAEFFAALEKVKMGDNTKMQAFVNTTLGETWLEDAQTVDPSALKNRAEPYTLRIVPMGGLLLLAAIDTQDNRLEVSVWAYGRGCETWLVDHRKIFGDPSLPDVWSKLNDYLDTEFTHASGKAMHVFASAIDSRGHHTQAVYAWCYARRNKNTFAVAGHAGRERAIVHGSTAVDLDWKGRRVKKGVTLWQVGTNLAKDLILNRLNLEKPGPGYIHFSDQLPDEYFSQFTGETRATRLTARGEESRWVRLAGRRVEALDCRVYVTFLEAWLQLDRRPASFWDRLEEKVQPKNRDLFEPESRRNTDLDIEIPSPAKLPRPKARKHGGFSATRW